MKRVLAISILFVCGLGLFFDTALADIVKLKNGREITGKIKEVTDTHVILSMGPGSVGFQLSQVESINNLSVEEARGRLSTQRAFLTHDKQEAIKASFNEGINFVSKTRKLEFKTIPETEFVTKDKLKENFKKSIDLDFDKENLDQEAKLLVKMGLISRPDDYRDAITDLFSEQVAGYYNDEEKKIFVDDMVLDEIRPGMPSMTVMHEQVHALQDQYFDLSALHKELQTASADRAIAAKSVIEGEATVLMYDAFFRSMKGFGIMRDAEKTIDLRSFVIDSMLAYSKRLKSNNDEPAIFMESIFFPYVWGGSFIQYTVNTKGWEAVGEIFKDMPLSSEQIMHPEKYYIIRDNPKDVTINEQVKKLIGGTWVRLDSNTLGEFRLYLIGKKFLDELSAKMMSEGWGGDSYEFYEEPETQKTLLIFRTQWDTEPDAKDFLTFYRKIIEKKYPQLVPVKAEVALYEWKDGQDNIYISRVNDMVTVIEGATDVQLTGLSELFGK